MTPRDDMLARMRGRASAVVPEGEPIIPDGPVATTEDIQEFKRLVTAMGYQAKFGQQRAVTKPGHQRVDLTARCTVGILSDEYLHVWNNFTAARGRYLDDATAEEHRALGSTLRLSGSSNDRRFHQLELKNYVQFMETSGGAIPVFLWRTFSTLKRAGDAG